MDNFLVDLVMFTGHIALNQTIKNFTVTTSCEMVKQQRNHLGWTLINAPMLLVAWIVLIICGNECVGQQLACKDAMNGRVQAKAAATIDQIFITVTIESEWHIYAPGSKAGVPLTVKMNEGSDFSLAGDIHVEQNEKGEVGGVATIRIPIERSGEGNKLDFDFDYQACDALECEEPVRLNFVGDVSNQGPRKVLLVVDANDERAQRISKLISDAGIDCETHLYKDELSREFCDSFDVVITDCPGFRNSRDGLAAVEKFPRTDTPIIAVGFLGTRLIENHKLALTSGYI